MTDTTDHPTPTETQHFADVAALRRLIAKVDSGLLPNDVLERIAQVLLAAGWRRP